jgi:hypothetical protein
MLGAAPGSRCSGDRWFRSVTSRFVSVAPLTGRVPLRAVPLRGADRGTSKRGPLRWVGRDRRRSAVGADGWASEAIRVGGTGGVERRGAVGADLGRGTVLERDGGPADAAVPVLAVVVSEERPAEARASAGLPNRSGKTGA